MTTYPMLDDWNVPVCSRCGCEWTPAPSGECESCETVDALRRDPERLARVADFIRALRDTVRAEEAARD